MLIIEELIKKMEEKELQACCDEIVAQEAYPIAKQIISILLEENKQLKEKLQN